MDHSTRRNIAFPQADRSDVPDLPLYYKYLVDALELDVVYVQGTAAGRAGATHMAGVIWRETDTGLFWWDDGATWRLMTGESMGANVASATNITISAPSHKITGSTTIDQIIDSTAFAGKTVKFIFQATITVRHNVSNIRLQGGIHAGFVANETLTLIYDGTNWIEHGRSPRHLSGEGGITYSGSANPSGLLAEDGSAVSATTYAALFANIGTLYGTSGGNVVLPDSRGRADFGYASGGHADVATIGLTDGVTFLSRRPKHKHNVTVNQTISSHSHVYGREVVSLSGGATGYSIIGNGATLDHSTELTQPTASGGAVGPQTGAEPLDSVPYLVRPKFIRI